MKQITILILTMLFFIVAFSQPLPDKIKTKYLAAKTDEQKRKIFKYISWKGFYYR